MTSDQHSALIKFADFSKKDPSTVQWAGVEKNGGMARWSGEFQPPKPMPKIFPVLKKREAQSRETRKLNEYVIMKQREQAGTAATEGQQRHEKSKRTYAEVVLTTEGRLEEQQPPDELQTEEPALRLISINAMKHLQEQLGVTQLRGKWKRSERLLQGGWDQKYLF